MPAEQPKLKERPQHDRFIEPARNLGADETQGASEPAISRVARASETRENVAQPRNQSSNPPKPLGRAR